MAEVQDLLRLLCSPICKGVAMTATNEGGIEFLAKKKAEEGVKCTASGLCYKVLEKGVGTQSPKADTRCQCYYKGTFVNGTQFDASLPPMDPFDFAPNEVIPGWTEAIQMMHEGDKWELYLICELGYGPEGDPPFIPANSCLVFEIELIRIGR